MMAHKVLTDGNGSSLIRVVGMGDYMPLSDYEALQAEYNKCAALLPDSRYMDPPDGGSVEVSEQLRRMVEDLKGQVAKLSGRLNSYTTALVAALDQIESDTVAIDAEFGCRSVEQLYSENEMPQAAKVIREILIETGVISPDEVE